MEQMDAYIRTFSSQLVSAINHSDANNNTTHTNMSAACLTRQRPNLRNQILSGKKSEPIQKTNTKDLLFLAVILYYMSRFYTKM